MANVQVIRAAMAAQVQRYCSPLLRAQSTATGSLNPPCAVVLPSRSYINYGTTLEGMSQFLGAPSGLPTISPTQFGLDVLVVVSQAAPLDYVSEALDQWLGAQDDGTAVSVVAAIGMDPTLGDLVEWCIPMTADAPGPLEWAGPEMFGARIHFSISAP